MMIRSIVLSVIVVLLLAPVSWGGVQVNTIPAPPSTMKPRIYVYALTIEPAESRRGPRWGTTHEDFAAKQVISLEKIGSYEIVSDSDMQAAIGDQYMVYSQLESKDWSLVRELGKALHADYGMVVYRTKEKGMQGWNYVFRAVLINTATGRNFTAGFTYELSVKLDAGELGERTQQVYREIFDLAKDDLLAVAAKKAPPAPK